MIREHILNREKSKEVYNLLEDKVTPKRCYNNVWEVFNNFEGRFESGEWKVGYGYVSIFPDQPLMARHCFVVNEQGEVIDPTIVSLNSYKDDEERTYFSFVIFESKDYLDALHEENYDPSLLKCLRLIERDVVVKWADDRGLLLMS